MAILQKRALVSFIVLASLLVMYRINVVDAHGRIIDPPGRSSMWRFGYNVPADYNDNGVNCGGFGAQFNAINRGRCGECGDEWSISRPRPREEGGIYGRGIIGQIWAEGSEVQLTIQITANHLGYFEFRLCPKQSNDEWVTQECLDRHLLELVDVPGTGGQVDGTRFVIEQTNGFFFPVVRLPAGVTCHTCVLQWYYVAGNNWGICEDGTGALGCGPQETYVNCADIAIISLE